MKWLVIIVLALIAWNEADNARDARMANHKLKDEIRKLEVDLAKRKYECVSFEMELKSANYKISELRGQFPESTK